mgnify:CR=1 FL=1
MQMKNHFLWAVIAIVSFFVNIVIYYLAYIAEDDSSLFTGYTQIMIIVWAALCVVAFYMALKDFGLSTTPGKAWLFLLLGLGCWLVGDVIFAYYQEIVHEDAFPSAADYAFTVGYVFLLIGIVWQLTQTKSQISKKELLITLIITLVIFVGALILVLIPIASYPIGEDFTVNQMIFSLVYPIGDLILFPCAVLLYFKFRGGQFAKGWIILSIGFIVAVIFDLAFSYYDWIGVENVFFVLDHFEIGYYMILGGGALFFRELLRSV